MQDHVEELPVVVDRHARTERRIRGGRRAGPRRVVHAERAGELLVDDGGEVGAAEHLDEPTDHEEG